MHAAPRSERRDGSCPRNTVRPVACVVALPVEWLAKLPSTESEVCCGVVVVPVRFSDIISCHSCKGTVSGLKYMKDTEMRQMILKVVKCVDLLRRMDAKVH